MATSSRGTSSSSTNFRGNLVTSVGYVGTASVNGFAFLDINASQIPGSGNAGRPLSGSGARSTTREWDGRTHSNYHSLQTTINRRVTGGLFLRALTPTPMRSTWRLRRLDRVYVERAECVQS